MEGPCVRGVHPDRDCAGEGMIDTLCPTLHFSDPMPTAAIHIAVLDDEPMLRKAMSRLLKTHGFAVHLFEDGRELIATMAWRTFDCLLIDLHMPEVTGFDMLEVLCGRLPVIVITGHDQPGTEERVRALGARDYLHKPLDEAALIEALGKVIPQLRGDQPGSDGGGPDLPGPASER